MLRNDGKLLGCPAFSDGSITYCKHPYLIGSAEINTQKDFYRAVLNSLNNNSLEWLYKNTAHQDVKDNINLLINWLSKNNKINKLVQPFLSKFNYQDHSKEMSIADAKSLFELLENELNQEFLRVRTSDMFYGGSGKDIYFRVSSIGFNWFDLIWQTVYDNRNFISSVTVVTDPDSQKTDVEEFYSHNGEELDHMPVDEFINLSGRPVIESVITNKNGLLTGKSLYESFSRTRPDRICQYFYYYREKENDERTM